MRGADLRGLVGIGSRESVDFRGAALRGANRMGFKDQSATPSKWRGAKYDRTTKWPQGFESAEVEAVLYVGDAPKKPQDTGDRKAKATPEGRDFRGQDLSKRTFEDKDLSRASPWNVACMETVFQRVILTEADLAGTDLTDARFARATSPARTSDARASIGPRSTDRICPGPICAKSTWARRTSTAAVSSGRTCAT